MLSGGAKDGGEHNIKQYTGHLRRTEGAAQTITPEWYDSPDATIETIMPERHIFFGNTYLYGRIVSVFGKNGIRGRKGAGRMMKYMMLSGMMKGKEGGMGSLLPLMLLGGKGGMADDLFDFDGFDMDDNEDVDNGDNG